MRVGRERLIFLALCALDEILDQAEAEPVRPSFALRFTLALLFALSDGKERDCYNAFWRCVTPRRGNAPVQSQGARHEYADSHLRGIAKSLGIDFEVELREAINRARGLPRGHRSLKTKLWNAAAIEDSKQKERARGARFCDLERVEVFPKGRGSA